MTNKEAFAVGFLSRLAERGVTPKQFEKRALLEGFARVPGEMVEGAGRVVSALSPMALAALVGVPAAAGILTGWGHAEMSDVTDEDIKRMKMRDYIDTYGSESKRIRRKLKRTDWRDEDKKQKTPITDF